MNKAFPPDRTIIDSYESGSAIWQIAVKYRISTGYVHKRLRINNIKTRPRGLPFGFTHSDETKKRMSIAQRGKVVSEQGRKNISEARKSLFNGLNGYGHTKLHRSGYILAYVPKHPRATADGYVMLHTVLMEQSIGRYLSDSEVVHHLNHVRDDNRPDNLLLMDKKQHMSMHMKQRHAKNRGDLQCSASF